MIKTMIFEFDFNVIFFKIFKLKFNYNLFISIFDNNEHLERTRGVNFRNLTALVRTSFKKL
jgi:hypothetical protein